MGLDWSAMLPETGLVPLPTGGRYAQGQRAPRVRRPPGARSACSPRPLSPPRKRRARPNRCSTTLPGWASSSRSSSPCRCSVPPRHRTRPRSSLLSASRYKPRGRVADGGRPGAGGRRTARGAEARAEVRVWPNSQLTLYQDWAISAADVADPKVAAPAAEVAHVDCRPFSPGVSVENRGLARRAAGVGRGPRGKDVNVAIIDEGVNGEVYPVAGGLHRQSSRPGTAEITSHGSMCAADALIASPERRSTTIRSSAPELRRALAMFQACSTSGGSTVRRT